jgi:hypothetical protein
MESKVLEQYTFENIRSFVVSYSAYNPHDMFEIQVDSHEKKTYIAEACYINIFGAAHITLTPDYLAWFQWCRLCDVEVKYEESDYKSLKVLLMMKEEN